MSRWRETPRAGEGLLEHTTPYVHWWATRDGPAQGRALTLDSDTPSDGAIQLRPCRRSLGHRAPGDVDAAFGTGQGEDILALPDHAAPPGGLQSAADALPDDLDQKIPDLTRDTVIVGVIDDGIAFGHSRFQRPRPEGGMGTRILSTWLQEGIYDTAPLPFGREIYQADIDAGLARHSAGGAVDEAAFYRDLAPGLHGGLSPEARRLQSYATHGTHVMDMACGADPLDPAQQRLSRERIIAVNLPSRRSIGMAGTFLELYVIYAMRRIVALADKLWADRFADSSDQAGFPVVINLSYGQQAGIKTGSSLIEQEFRQLQLARGAAPLRLVMPVGNDNLNRVAAHKELKASMSLNWRVLPQDQSSNFVEIWSDVGPREDTSVGAMVPLKLTLSRPGYDETLSVPARVGHYYDNHNGQARIYAEVVDVPDMSDAGQQAVADALAAGTPLPPPVLQRWRYVIALRPTDAMLQADVAADAGVWRIDLEWARPPKTPEGRDVFVHVQVDQSPEPDSRINQRSYFDDPAYRSYAPNGRVLDSFAYRETEMAPPPGALVSRQGTQNALANHRSVMLIAGHRLSDGRPTPLSATTFPEARVPDAIKGEVSLTPTASLPVDVTPMLTGMRAAAPASGATTVLRGTSFAAPQAARWAIAAFHEALATGTADLSDVATPEALAWEAEAEEARQAGEQGWPDAAAAKVGSGRLLPRSTRPIVV